MRKIARGPGRPKGTMGKNNALLQGAILAAAEYVGSHDYPLVSEETKDGLIAYLIMAARENPTGFLRLLGQILPHMTSDNNGFVYNLHLDFSPPITQDVPRGTFELLEDSKNDAKD